MPDSAVRKPDPAAKKPAPEKSAEMQPAGKKPVEGSKPHARDLRGSIPEVAPAQAEALRGLFAAHRQWTLGDGGLGRAAGRVREGPCGLRAVVASNLKNKTESINMRT